MTTVRLIDGREVDSASEDWRHETEARMVCNYPTLHTRRDYLQTVELKRGKAEADRLRATMAKVWEEKRLQPQVRRVCH